MAPTRTTNYALLKPAVGGDNNQWGDTLNATLDQVDTVLKNTSTRVVADIAARDLLFPLPAINDTVDVKSLGYRQRFGAPAAGASQWLSTGLTRDAGPVITTQSKGLIANGVADDTPFFAAADADAVTSGGRHELDALTATQTRIFINSDLTLSSHFRPNPGLKGGIYVNAGKTLTIAGGFDPGIHTVFDPTSPGNIVYTSRKIRNHFAQWYGIVGDGVTDDAPAFSKMLTVLPNRANVIYTHQTVMRWNSMVTWTNGFGIRHLSDLHPFDTTTNGSDAGPKIIWGGAAHGIMLTMNGCGYCTFTGFVFQCTLNWGDTLGADVCIDLHQDIPPANRISTTDYFHRCTFFGGAGNTGQQLVRISFINLTSNNEYHHFEECQFWNMDLNFAYLGLVPGNSVSINIGVDNTLVTSPQNVFAAWMVGKDIHIQNANGGAILGGRLDSTIAAMVGAPDVNGHFTQARIANAATTTVAGVHAVIGNPAGAAIYQGAQNSHRTRVTRCQFYNFDRACDIRAGSMHFDDNLWDGCRYDIVPGPGLTMACSEKFSNSESSQCHILNQGGTQYTMEECRFAFVGKMPNEGWIQCAVASQIKMSGGNFDQEPQAGESIFQFIPPGDASKIILEQNWYGSAGFQNIPDSLLFGGDFATVCASGLLLQTMDALVDPSGSAGAIQHFRMVGLNGLVRFSHVNVLLNTVINLVDAELLNGDFYFKDNGLAGPRMILHRRTPGGTIEELGLRPGGFIAVGPGNYLQPDLTLYSDFDFTSNSAAPHIDFSLVGSKGDEFTICLRNASGGAMVTNWDATYIFTGGAWVDPANTKAKFVKFKKLSIGSGNFQYEVWRTPDFTP